MSYVKLQTGLLSPDGGPLLDITDGYATALAEIILEYAPGFGQILKGLRPFSAEDTPIPCVQIQSVESTKKIATNIKYLNHYIFDMWFGVGDSTIDATHAMVTSGAEIFKKLFSNNALNDVNSASKSNAFKVYNGFLDGYGSGGFGAGGFGGTPEAPWLDSQMTKVLTSIPFLRGKANGPKYYAVGNFQLTLETQQID